VGKTVLKIDSSLAGQRIDKALASHPEIRSRSRAAQLLHEGRILLSGREIKASHKTTSGEIFDIDLPDPTPAELQPYPIALDILFEDRDVLVVNKPAGLVVHPAAGHHSDTLVNALIHHTRDLAMGFGESRPGIVHRLDKDTSGLLVVAKNDLSQEVLVRQFKERSIHRLYWAVVLGMPNPASGTQRSYIQRHPTHRKRFASGAQGKLAITHYQFIKSHPSGISLLHCKLETGRTHQIRVHMSDLKCPIAGDILYGADRRLKNIATDHLRSQVRSMPRIGLHAAELGFTHPTTGERHLFRVNWPEDLTPLLKDLQWS